MSGAFELNELLKNMRPVLNPGVFVFCTMKDLPNIPRSNILMEFKEDEGTTLILRKEKADLHGLPYNYCCAWITLKIHSALEAKGFTAAFSAALSKNDISCNVVAAFYHDHIFVAQEDGQKALEVLKNLSDGYY